MAVLCLNSCLVHSMQVLITAALLATTAALHSSGSALLRRGHTTISPTHRLRYDRQRSVVFHGGSHSHAHHDHEHEVIFKLMPLSSENDFCTSFDLVDSVRELALIDTSKHFLFFVSLTLEFI